MKWLRRNWLRIVILVVASLVAFPWAEYVPMGTKTPEGWQAVLPRLSPLLNIFGALAARQWVGWTILLGVPLAVFAFFKGRTFCWRMCPMGFLAELAGKLNPWGKKNVQHVPAINKVLALLIVVSAAFGYPLAIWLDPLCIFNGFFAGVVDETASVQNDDVCVHCSFEKHAMSVFLQLRRHDFGIYNVLGTA